MLVSKEVPLTILEGYQSFWSEESAMFNKTCLCWSPYLIIHVIYCSFSLNLIHDALVMVS